jgi:ATP-binding cassette subfamily B protein
VARLKESRIFLTGRKLEDVVPKQRRKIYATLQDLFRLLEKRDYTKLGVLALLLSTGAAATSFLPLLLKWAVDADKFASTAVALPIAAYAGVLILRGVASEARTLVYGSLEQSIQQRAYSLGFATLQQGSLTLHLRSRAGSTVQTLIQGVAGYRSLFNVLVWSVFPLLVEMFVAAFILATTVPFRYVLIVLAGLIFYTVIFTRSIETLRLLYRDGLGHFIHAGGIAGDAFSNIETIHLFKAERRIADRFNERLASAIGAWNVWYKRRTITGVSLALVLNVTFSLALVLSIYDLSTGSITVGTVVMIATYLVQFGRPVELIGTSLRDLRQAAESIEALQDLAAAHEESADQLPVISQDDAGDAIEAKAITLRIGDRTLLDQVDLTVARGARVGLLGPSGAGKSTLIRVIAGLIKPSDGQISTSGQSQLGPSVVVVPQDPSLLNDTLRANLLLGNTGASDEEILAVLAALGLTPLFKELAKGLDTIVGERGHLLSGGERQRIAIARALLCKPAILLLDEATSSLDLESEEMVLKAVSDSIPPEAALIWVTHRLHPSIHLDSILYLAKGQLKQLKDPPKPPLYPLPAQDVRSQQAPTPEKAPEAVSKVAGS